jgi:hypothetical protein
MERQVSRTPKGKYNVLLIRDDGETRSIRIGRGSIRFLLCLLLFLPVAAGGGLWIGWQSWQKLQEWDQQEETLQREITDLHAQLERMYHIQRLAQAHYAEHTAASDPGPAAKSELPKNDPAGGANAPAATPPVAGETNGDPAQTPAPAAEQTPSGEELNLIEIDTGQVSLSNINAKLNKERILSLGMNLHNESEHQLAGILNIFLLTADLQRHPIPYDDVRFRISRRKNFSGSAFVPEAAGDLADASLLIEVVSDQTLIYRRMYPISR